MLGFWIQFWSFIGRFDRAVYSACKNATWSWVLISKTLRSQYPTRLGWSHILHQLNQLLHHLCCDLWSKWDGYVLNIGDIWKLKSINETKVPKTMEISTLAQVIGVPVPGRLDDCFILKPSMWQVNHFEPYPFYASSEDAKEKFNVWIL